MDLGKMKLGKRTILKLPLNQQLKYTPDDLRWATPQPVADYRAQRLRCKTIADIGCGIGFQAFSLAKTCQKVYAIDIDGDKLQRAKSNAAALGLRNIEFIHGDALDQKVVGKLKYVDIIFCDPQRPAQEKERSLEQISPNIKTLIQVYSKLTSKLAVEFPPQMKEIHFDCEREYLSVDGALNRLTLYFNELKQAERSAVVLPGGQRLLSSPKKAVLKKSKRLLPYFYEVDPAVVKAGLLAELSQQTATALYVQEKSTFFTSKVITESSFFKLSFKVLRETNLNKKEIISALQQEGAGTVIIRYRISPLQYWPERKMFESSLVGKKTVQLFRFGEKAVI